MNDKVVGKVTSAVYSPRLEQNIALAMVERGADQIGAEVTVDAIGGLRQARQVEMPFYDPKKNIAKS